MLHVPVLSNNVRRSSVSPKGIIGMNFFLTRFRLDYTWIDQNRRQIKLAAPTYIDYVMTWVQNLLDDDLVFPTKAGKSMIFFVYFAIQ